MDIEGSPHEEDIRFIIKRGLTVGCDLDGPRYCPDNPVTRAQMATFLVRALGLDTTVPHLGVYSDVEEGAWFTPFVEALGAHGLTDTQVSETYRPYDPMLRSEMAIFLQKAFRLPLNDDTSASSFQDIPADAPYADAAEAVLEVGITQGCGVDPLRYCPDDTVKRDTMAAFLARALRASDLQKVLDLAPNREKFKAISIGEQIWKVWFCENTPVREDLVVYLNREISPYYRWLSGGQYQMRFEYGTDPSPEVTSILERCNYHVDLGIPDGPSVLVGSDLGAFGLGRAWANPQTQRFEQTSWMDKRALDDTRIHAHEIGHTLGWPHNWQALPSPHNIQDIVAASNTEALSAGMDIMASHNHLVGTNAYHLFHVGWIDPQKVALHTGATATYTIAPPHTSAGVELLMLPLGPDRFISVGARVKEGFDQNIPKEGIELYDIVVCPGHPQCKFVFLPAGARPNDPIVLDVGDSWAADMTTNPDGGRSLTLDIRVSVTARHNSSYTVQVEQTSVVEEEVSSITLGEGRCMLLTSGAVFCRDPFIEGPVPEGTYTSLDLGAYVCGTKTDGTLACWGRSYDGITTPSGKFTSVSVTVRHSCGLREDRTVACWGLDFEREPVTQSPDGEFLSIGTGASHACGVRLDQTVQCWGRNHAGQPVSPAPTGEFVAVSSGKSFSCGLRMNGTLVCWSVDQRYYIEQPPAETYKDVDTGAFHACGIRTNGTVTCWDYDGYELSPPGGIFTSISVGYRYACGLRPDHTIECWQ